MDLQEVKVSGTKVPQYIFIYVYIQWMSGMREVREGVEKVKVKLKGTSRPSNKNPIGEYISNRGLFYLNFLLDFLSVFLRGFSIRIFYSETCANKVIQKIKLKR